MRRDSFSMRVNLLESSSYLDKGIGGVCAERGSWQGGEAWGCRKDWQGGRPGVSVKALQGLGMLGMSVVLCRQESVVQWFEGSDEGVSPN